jgi:hypothetical protein
MVAQIPHYCFRIRDVESSLEVISYVRNKEHNGYLRSDLIRCPSVARTSAGAVATHSNQVGDGPCVWTLPFVVYLTDKPKRSTLLFVKARTWSFVFGPGSPSLVQPTWPWWWPSFSASTALFC